MPDLTKTAGTLIAEVRQSISQEMLGTLQPILKKIVEAVSDLEKALGSSGAPAKTKRGKNGPKAAKPGRKPRSRQRGQLQELIKSILQSAKKPARLADIRDHVLQDPAYKDRNPKTLYTQISQTIKNISEIQKSADSKYTIKAQPAKKTPKAKG